MDVVWYSLAAVLLLVVAGFVVARRRVGSIEDEIAAARRSGSDLDAGLAKSRNALGGALRAVWSRSSLDEAFYEGLEDVLVGVDVGHESAKVMVDAVRKSSPADADAARSELKRQLDLIMEGRERELRLDGRPAVVLVVGVNGTGKTTSIAKLARKLTDDGRSVLLGAADTFRAAADTQLRVWADRIGVDVVGGQTGADPAAVAFDAYKAAQSRDRDVVIIDTAGRLHSKQNLMSELAKIRKVIEREAGTIGEVLLVIDATAGQNAINQARQFTDVAGVTGIILTKIDGTAKGGVVVAIERELGVPVKLIGVGETVEDLVAFSPEHFVSSLIGDS